MLDNTQTLPPLKSYIDPSLDITEDLYAISYVKKNYESKSSLPEHAFM
ncbi:MAG: hypothetical protein K0R73_787 [Candidatus Midichloriaceae bacterium]|nr:hypothetical protein [Candidatus Midichloriaceae bacterium]